MKRIKREIDLSTEEKKKEFFDILDGFKCKKEAYEYLGICGNSYGIIHLNELANAVGFNLNIYSERRKTKSKVCLCCGEKFIPKTLSQKFCSLSCAASYNNKKRDEISNETRRKLSESLKIYYKEHPKEAKNGVRRINGKKTRIEPKKCPICGSIDCERKGICGHTKKFFENLTYFGFDIGYLGTDRVFEEYERVKRY
jgi:hypothetical protein